MKKAKDNEVFVSLSRDLYATVLECEPESAKIWRGANEPADGAKATGCTR